MISPRQMQMARSAINMKMAELGELAGISKAAISLYEKGNESRLSDKKVAEIMDLFNSRMVFFGPNDGVCYGIDRFSADNDMIFGLIKALGDAGAMPCSREIIKKIKEAKEL